MPSPIRIAVVNDFELVVAGVEHLMRQHPEVIEVRERIIVGQPIDDGPIDVVLFDTYGRGGFATFPIRQLVADPEIGAVALFSLDLAPELIEDARAAGVAGFISKGLDGADIAAAIVAVAAGDPVVVGPRRADEVAAPLDWPGRRDGLSARQSEVLVLVADGLTNREVADALYLSVETVKSYLRDVFARLGFRNRVEATAYVHGAVAGGRTEVPRSASGSARELPFPAPR